MLLLRIAGPAAHSAKSRQGSGACRQLHSEPWHGQREHEACAGSGQRVGKVHPESRFCSERTSARCRINSDFYNVAPWRPPSLDSIVGRLF